MSASISARNAPCIIRPAYSDWAIRPSASGSASGRRTARTDRVPSDRRTPGVAAQHAGRSLRRAAAFISRNSATWARSAARWRRSARTVGGRRRRSANRRRCRRPRRRVDLRRRSGSGQQGEEQVLLAGEVGVDGALGDAGFIGDVGERRGHESVARNSGRRRGADRVRVAASTRRGSGAAAGRHCVSDHRARIDHAHVNLDRVRRRRQVAIGPRPGDRGDVTVDRVGRSRCRPGRPRSAGSGSRGCCRRGSR